MWLLCYFYFEKNYDVLKSKSPCFLLNKNIKFSKNKTESKMKIPRLVLERWTMCFSWHKTWEWKIKLWWAGTWERKKSASTFILSEAIFFYVWVLSQCIVYWIIFQNIYTFTYQKSVTSHTFVACFLKLSKAFSVSLTYCFGFVTDG